MSWRCCDCANMVADDLKWCPVCTPAEDKPRAECDWCEGKADPNNCVVDREDLFCTWACQAEHKAWLTEHTAVPPDGDKPVADRRNAGKTNFSHVDVFNVALEGVALNAEYGASKYDLWNFMKGAKSALESYNCAQRHQKKWLNGEDLVPDAVAAGFSVHHIDAAIWNLMRLRQELVTFPERDDRPCKVLKK